MNRTFCTFTLALLALSSIAQASRLETEVRAAYDRFRTAVEKADVATVNKLVVPGLIVNLPNGETLSRAGYLKALSDRKSVIEGGSTHTFTLRGVRESGGYVTAFVRLSLVSSFRDGNQGLHRLQSDERKTITFQRVNGNLRVARIDALEVRTSIDGKPASTLRRH